MDRERDRELAACERIRELMALGEPLAAPEVRAHVRECPACRGTAALLGRIRRDLAATAAIDPPRELDRLVRESLGGPPASPGFGLRPGIAAGLAVAALFALVVTLSTLLARAGAAEMGPVIAIVGVWFYLGVSFAATLPLLLQPRIRRRIRGYEVRP